MRTTTYTTDDKRQGYLAGQLAGILSRHHPQATIIVRPGWKGQPQTIIINEPDVTELTAHEATRLEAEARHTACETPPDAVVDRLGGTLTERVKLQGSLDATDDEEWLRDQLRARGVPVHVVEAVARRGMVMDQAEARAELAAYGIDLALIDEITTRYRERVRLRNIDRLRPQDGGNA